MDNFIQRLRMQNIFGNAAPLGMPDFSAGSVDPNQLLSRILKIRNAEKMDMLNRDALAESQAVTANAGQDLLARTGGPIGMLPAIAGDIANPSAVNHVFNPGMTDYQKAQLALGRERIGSQLDIAGMRTGVQQQNADTAKQRAQIAEFKAKNPGLKVLTPKGGNIQFMNPVTGEVTDSGISTGTMTEKELQDLRGEQAIEQIEGRGKESRETLEQAGKQRLNEIAARLAGEEITPTQEKARVLNEVNKLVIARPDLAEFIVRDSDGNVNISEKATPETRKLIENALYGKKLEDDITLKPDKKDEKPKPKAGEVKSKYEVYIEP